MLPISLLGSSLQYAFAEYQITEIVPCPMVDQFICSHVFSKIKLHWQCIPASEIIYIIQELAVRLRLVPFPCVLSGFFRGSVVFSWQVKHMLQPLLLVIFQTSRNICEYE